MTIYVITDDVKNSGDNRDGYSTRVVLAESANQALSGNGQELFWEYTDRTEGWDNFPDGKAMKELVLSVQKHPNCPVEWIEVRKSLDVMLEDFSARINEERQNPGNFDEDELIPQSVVDFIESVDIGQDVYDQVKELYEQWIGY